MELTVKFGIDVEIERVKDTLLELDWFDKNGYKPKLPLGIGKNSSPDEIYNSIVKEYSDEDYKKLETSVAVDFLKIKSLLSRGLEKYINANAPDVFIVFLTNYGVGGSYDLPNVIIYNKNNGIGFKTIIHEIVHLLIEEKIVQYKVKHFEKERIVDLILNSNEFAFLDYNSWQKSYRGADRYIDKLFKEYFFVNQEKFFSKIIEARNELLINK